MKQKAISFFAALAPIFCTACISQDEVPQYHSPHRLTLLPHKTIDGITLYLEDATVCIYPYSHMFEWYEGHPYLGKGTPPKQSIHTLPIRFQEKYQDLVRKVYGVEFSPNDLQVRDGWEPSVEMIENMDKAIVQFAPRSRRQLSPQRMPQALDETSPNND
ncbi:MAG: hypothetical protein GC137_08695 [Alphaproteobacteria bacterium]|nr:hypothetical protein [Alphaproteobacteria bacterium]